MRKTLSLGKQIRIMRTVRGLNQGELAERLEMSQVTLSNYEKDKVVPNSERMQAIKAALDWFEQAEVAFCILAGDGTEP